MNALAPTPGQTVGPFFGYALPFDGGETFDRHAIGQVVYSRRKWHVDPRPLLAAWNTFVLDEHARMAVPGMAVLYERLTTAYPGAPVLYLSTGAWNVLLSGANYTTAIAKTLGGTGWVPVPRYPQ